MIPLFAPYPTNEYDLPEPVCPYAKRQQLKPAHAFSSTCAPSESYTACWSA